MPTKVELMKQLKESQKEAQDNFMATVISLKKLTEAGDPIARKVFQQEIVKKFEQGHIQTCLYLFKEKHNFNV